MIPFDRDAVLGILSASDTRLTAQAFIGEIARSQGISPRKAKAVLAELVNDGTLAYQDLYGATYITESFSKPVRLTDRFWVSPPGMAPADQPGNLNVEIVQGISFGSGHHPTTRLCLRALDRLFFQSPDWAFPPDGYAGDIGTGSGILAIAACLAGAGRCTAWEIDANALSEAGQNIRLNSLEDRISLINGLMASSGRTLSLLCANLRAPTLDELAPMIGGAVVPDGRIVFSGIRPWETDRLTDTYQSQGFVPEWTKEEKNWAAVILRPAG